MDQDLTLLPAPKPKRLCTSPVMDAKEFTEKATAVVFRRFWSHVHAVHTCAIPQTSGFIIQDPNAIDDPKLRQAVIAIQERRATMRFNDSKVLQLPLTRFTVVDELNTNLYNALVAICLRQDPNREWCVCELMEPLWNVRDKQASANEEQENELHILVSGSCVCEKHKPRLVLG